MESSSMEAPVPNLHVAAADKKIDEIKYLLLVGVDANLKNEDGLTALQVAVSKSMSDSHYDICKELIAKGASVLVHDRDGYTPLQVSVKNEKNIKIAELLIDEGAYVNDKSKNEQEETALHQVSRHNRPEYMKLLMSKGALVNAANKFGKTALHLAALFSKNNSHLAVIEHLLDSNANPNAQDNGKNTPLLAMFYTQDNDVIETNGLTISLLLDKGADVNIKNVSDITLLHIAVSRNITHEIIELIISRAAVVDSKDEGSKTPLMFALGCNENDSSLENLKVLLAHGANINVEENGKTPLDSLIEETQRELYNVKTFELFLNKNAEFYGKNSRTDYFKVLRQCLKMMLKSIEKKNSDAMEQVEKKYEERIKNLEAEFNAQKSKLSKDISDIVSEQKKWHTKFTKEPRRKFRILKKRNNTASAVIENTIENTEKESSMVSRLVKHVHDVCKKNERNINLFLIISFIIILTLILILHLYMYLFL